MRIVGLDLALTATGIADEHGTRCFRSKSRGMERLDEILTQVRGTGEPRPELVVIEGYSFGSHSAHAHELGELGGVIRYDLWRVQIPYVDVAPAVLKKFTTGKGNASKFEVIAAAIRRWGFEGSDENEADAYMLRMMGLCHYDVPAVMPDLEVPGYAREGLAKVQWPLAGVSA